MPRVVVIGAGWAGLVAAKTYLQLEPQTDLLIVDNDSSLGGTWSKERLYLDLVAEAHHGLFEYSDLPMSSEGIRKDGRIPGEAVHRYLVEYAAKFDLTRRIRLRTRVLAVKQDQQSKLWTVKIEGSPEILRCDKLIIATGLTSEPQIPNFEVEDFEGEVVHTKALGLPETIDRIQRPEVKHVVVYGGSKSAFDAVYLLINLGKTVEWIIRPGNGPSIMSPLRIMGSPTFRLSNSRFMGIFSPTVFDLSSTYFHWLHGPKSRPLARKLVKGFWKTMTYLTLRPANYSASQNGKLLRPELGLFWSSATLGLMTQPELWEDIHRGEKIKVHRRSISGFSGSRVKFSDGGSLETDMTVLATGWKTKHPIFSAEDCLKYGLPCSQEDLVSKQLHWTRLDGDADAKVQSLLPLLKETPRILGKDGMDSASNTYRLYRHVVPATATSHDRNIAFVGMLRTTGAPIVFEAQALWAAAYLSGRLTLPPVQDMEMEAALSNAWIKRRYICGQKVPFALFDYMAYVDVLYNDLGINSHRKSNWFDEMFGLYQPKDFEGVADELLHKSDARGTKTEFYSNLGTSHGAFLVLVLVVMSAVVLLFPSA